MKSRAMNRLFVIPICLMLLGFILPFPAMGGVGLARQQAGAITVTENFSTYNFRSENFWTDWNVWQHQLSLNKMSAWSRDNLTAVMQPDGSAFVAWADYRGRQHNLFMQKLDRAGNRLWQQDVQINDPAPSPSRKAPTLVLDGQGGVFCVFEDSRVLSDPNNAPAHLFAQRINAAGQRLWSPDLLISQNALMSDEIGHAATAAPGGLAVAWKEGEFASGNQTFYAQRFDLNGAPVFAQPVKLWGPADFTYTYLGSLTANPQGALLATWIKINNFDTRDQPVMGQWVEPSGALRTPAPLILVSGQQFPGAHAVAAAARADGITKDGQWQLAAPRQVGADLPYPQTQISDRVGALDAAGDVTIAYNLGHSILAQSFTPDSRPRSPAPNAINDLDGTARQFSPRSAAGQDNSTFILWQSRHPGGADLFLQRVNETGAPLLPVETRLDMGPSSDDLANAVQAVDGANNAAVAWEYNDGTRTEIRVQKIRADGARLWTSDKAVVAGSTVNQTQPAVTADAAGNIYVAWTQPDQKSILLQKFSPDGSRQWNAGIPANVTAVPASWQLFSRDFPALDMTPQGQLLVAWTQNTQEPIGPDSFANHNRVFAQRFSPAGQPQWAADQPVNAPDNDFNHPYNLALSVDPSGGAYFLVNYEGAYDDVTLMGRFTVDGKPVWPADLQWSDPHHLFTNAHMAAAPDGGAVLAWEATSPNPHIAANKLSASGTWLWPNDRWVNDLPMRFARFPWVAVLPNGTSTVAYELQAEGGNEDVFFTRLSSAGERTLGTTPVLNTDLFYQPVGEARSLSLNPGGPEILSATLRADVTLNGGSLTFYLSNDGGAHWDRVTPGTAQTFTAQGSDVRWRVVMTAGPGWKTTPVIHSISVEMQPAGPVVVAPSDFIYLPFIRK